MEIRIEINKLFDSQYAIGVKAANGSRYTIVWGDGNHDTFTGTGKPQRHSHDYIGYPVRQNYNITIESSADDITGIFMRYAALIYDIPPVRLAAIDVSQCSSLEQLALPQFSGIEELSLKGNPRLRNLSLECHSMQELDLSGNSQLEYLYLALCRNLRVLDLRNCPSLKVLDIVGTYSLKNLHLSEGIVLDKVKVSKRCLDQNQQLRTAITSRRTERF